MVELVRQISRVKSESPQRTQSIVAMTFAVFALSYEKKLATNTTNSNELTPSEFVLVRTSSLLFSFPFMVWRFIADFAVRLLRYLHGTLFAARALILFSFFFSNEIYKKPQMNADLLIGYLRIKGY